MQPGERIPPLPRHCHRPGIQRRKAQGGGRPGPQTGAAGLPTHRARWAAILPTSSPSRAPISQGPVEAEINGHSSPCLVSMGRLSSVSSGGLCTPRSGKRFSGGLPECQPLLDSTPLKSRILFCFRTFYFYLRKGFNNVTKGIDSFETTFQSNTKY